MKKDREYTLPPYQLILDQGLAAWIAQVNAERRVLLFQALDAVYNDLRGQDKAFADALKEILNVREKISTPEHIIGSELTKHGEIAEIAEVGIRNAREIIQGRAGNAVWDSTDRFAVQDYTINDVSVQSKFYNGINNTLRGVIDHAKLYPDYGRTDDGYFHIARDQYETIVKILRGDNVGLSTRSADTIRAKVHELEILRNRSFDDLVRPASHDYADVTRGKIQQTLERHEVELSNENQTIKEDIQERHRRSIEKAQEASAPSFGELGKVMASGAVIGASLQMTVSVYQKLRVEKKSPMQWTSQDWEEIGENTLSGGIKGGVAAGALYGLTNYSSLSAPFAGAVVSSGLAMGILVRQYHAGEISFDEFTELSIVTTMEAGIAAAGAALGQTLIPIPIMGALIGGTVARLASAHGRRMLGAESDRFAERLHNQYLEAIAGIDAEHIEILHKLEEEILTFGELTSAAFDLNLNANLLVSNSIILATEYGVPQKEILRTTSDIDSYIYGLRRK